MMNEIAVDVFRFVHFVGLGLLLGGLVTQFSKPVKTVTTSTFVGTVVQLVSGIVLLVLTISDANHLKATVKLVILVVVFVVLVVARRRSFSNGAFLSALGLTVLILGLAVFW